MNSKPLASRLSPAAGRDSVSGEQGTPPRAGEQQVTLPLPARLPRPGDTYEWPGEHHFEVIAISGDWFGDRVTYLHNGRRYTDPVASFQNRIAELAMRKKQS